MAQLFARTGAEVDAKQRLDAALLALDDAGVETQDLRHLICAWVNQEMKAWRRAHGEGATTG
jgi:hypothetical protein